MVMETALIGATGFVGSTLLRQRRFDQLYQSDNIGDIKGREFSLVVCAGAPAQKWIANQDPVSDRARLTVLMQAIASVRCARFVLVSTVDVFADPRGVDEDSEVSEDELQPYGRHRRELERFVQDRFEAPMIVRLPGLVGPGLRKNVIYDFLNDNNVAAIDCRAVYQFYPTVALWRDIDRALENHLRLVHLTSEPLSVADVARFGFGRVFTQTTTQPPAKYDFQSRYAPLFGGPGRYQYSARESLLVISAYAQSEPRRHKH
jgi:nucleoside-diphosphate-sugar epimerase